MNIKRMPSDDIIKELDGICRTTDYDVFLTRTSEIINDLKRYELTPEEIQSRSFNPLESINISMPESLIDYGIFATFYEGGFTELSALIPQPDEQQDNHTRSMVVSLSENDLISLLKEKGTYIFIEQGDSLYRVDIWAYNSECEIFDMNSNDKATCYGIENIEATLIEIENESKEDGQNV